MSEPPQPTEPAPTPKQQQAVAHRQRPDQGPQLHGLRAAARKPTSEEGPAQGRRASSGAHEGRAVRAQQLFGACVCSARDAVPATSSPAGSGSTTGPTIRPDWPRRRRRQAERHRAGLPCGFETCAAQACVDAFAGTCPAPPGPATLQVDRVHQPDLRGQPHDPLTRPARPSPSGPAHPAHPPTTLV